MPPVPADIDCLVRTPDHVWLKFSPHGTTAVCRRCGLVGETENFAQSKLAASAPSWIDDEVKQRGRASRDPISARGLEEGRAALGRAVGDRACERLIDADRECLRIEVLHVDRHLAVIEDACPHIVVDEARLEPDEVVLGRADVGLGVANHLGAKPIFSKYFIKIFFFYFFFEKTQKIEKLTFFKIKKVIWGSEHFPNSPPIYIVFKYANFPLPRFWKKKKFFFL